MWSSADRRSTGIEGAKRKRPTHTGEEQITVLREVILKLFLKLIGRSARKIGYRQYSKSNV